MADRPSTTIRRSVVRRLSAGCMGVVGLAIVSCASTPLPTPASKSLVGGEPVVAKPVDVATLPSLAPAPSTSASASASLPVVAPSVATIASTERGPSLRPRPRATSAPGDRLVADEGTPEPHVSCGQGRCDTGEICCATTGRQHCVSSVAKCASASGDAIYIACEGPLDCGGGELCCDMPGDRVWAIRCVEASECGGRYVHPRYGTSAPREIVCDGPAQCPDGMYCDRNRRCVGVD